MASCNYHNLTLKLCYNASTLYQSIVVHFAILQTLCVHSLSIFFGRCMCTHFLSFKPLLSSFSDFTASLCAGPARNLYLTKTAEEGKFRLDASRFSARRRSNFSLIHPFRYIQEYITKILLGFERTFCWKLV